MQRVEVKEEEEEKEEACDRCVSGAGLMRLHPPFIQHVVLIRKGRVEEQPVYITNNNTVQYKHYSSSYPLVAFAFTCSGPCEPIQFEPPCVDYVSVVVS